MTLEETLIEVWRQVLVEGRPSVELAGESFPVTSTRAKRLRTVRFEYAPFYVDAIEQDPETSSRWALLAREGKRVMQFTIERRYIGNVAEGELVRYPAWNSMGLPD
jgi:hypothetical protein